MKSARRGFLKALAGAPLLPGGTLLAQTPAPAPAAATPAEAGPAGIAREDVVKGIEGNLKAADTLKAARALQNSDEPVVAFDPRTAALRAARGARR